MKTVFLVANNGFSVRNFFRTGILKTLVQNKVRCVLLFSKADEEEFIKEFQSENVFPEKYRISDYRNYTKRYKFSKYFSVLRNYLYNGKYQIQTLHDYLSIKIARENISKRKFNRYKFLKLYPLFLLKKSKFLRIMFSKFESKMFTPMIHKDLFEKYKPDCVVVSSTGTLDFDHYIMREAKSFGSKIISIIQSWDNTSSKGYSGIFPDLTFAWTDNMRRELENFLDIDKDKIIIGGVSHFDYYFDRQNFFSRDEFYRKLNLDPNKKLIFYASRSPSMYPWNPEVIEVIAKAINSNKFSVPVQLIVRIHPNHYVKKHLSDNINYTVQDSNMNEYIRLENKYKDLSLNFPQINTYSEKEHGNSNLKLSFDIHNSETKILSSLLKYSDVVVNLFSTINIEASIFNLPIVNIGFNGANTSPNSNIRHNIKFDERQYHNQRVINTGAVKIARNRNQLIKYIDNYLIDKNLDSEKRLLLKKNECGPYPGNSGKFIAENILNFI